MPTCDDNSVTGTKSFEILVCLFLLLIRADPPLQFSTNTCNTKRVALFNGNLKQRALREPRYRSEEAVGNHTFYKRGMKI